MSFFILIWVCASVAMIALAIRNTANEQLTLSDVFWITVLWPVVACIQINRLCNKHAGNVVWRRK